MKKVKKVKKMFLLVGGLFCGVCTSLAIAANVAGNADGTNIASWQESLVETSYAYGTTFTLPQRAITVDGTDYVADVSLKMPDGTVTTKSSVELTDGGVYTLSYIAIVNGKTYFQEETFTVDEAYVTCGAGSSAAYGRVNNRAKDEASRALIVRLAQGDTLRFSKPIDLNDVTKNDVLIELMAKPDVLNSCDFTHLTVTFTDVENSDIYFSVIFDAYGGAVNGNRAYTLACGNGQIGKGYYYGSNGTASLNTNQSGTSTAHSFAGTFDANNEYTKAALTISYDAAEKAVYTNYGRNMIVDLDSPECYPEGVWAGFSSGKVVMSIQADGYNMATANFNVYNAYDMDFQRNTVYVDKEAPVITINTDYEEMPQSVVGAIYSLPEAVAFDTIDGYVPVTKQVYFNYNSSTASQTVTLDGNTFVTDRVGYYAIVYTACDYHGNSVQEVLWINSRESLDKPVVRILDGAPKTGVVGERIAVANIECSGGSGALTSTVFVTSGEERLSVENETFLPQKSGTYTVCYEVTDFIGQTTRASYDVAVSVSSNPVFADEAALPKIFVSGSEYVVPEYVAYDYTSGKAVAKTASCQINGKTYQAGETFTPTVENNGDKVKLTFNAGNTKKEYEIPCIIAWGTTQAGRPKLYYENYLHSTDDTAVVVNTGSGLRINASGATASVTFVNKLYQSMFALQIKGVSGADRFETLTVLLHDSVNPYETVAVRFTQDGALTKYTAGETKYVDFDLTGEKTLELVYADGSFSANNTANEIKETIYGKPFTGFSSGYVWAEIRLEGVDGNAAILVEKVGNQIFGSLSTDSISPAIYLTADIGGVVSIGTEVVLPIAYAGDVLDPNITFTVSVTAPDGSVILDKVDPTQSHKVRLTEYGTYYVRYDAADTFNRSPNTFGYTYAYVIEDEEAPVLTLNTPWITEATVGETYILPQYTVTDNKSEESDVTVLRYFVGPNGRMKEIPKNSNSICFTQAGEYEIYIMATDAAGNVAFEKTTITVKEA